MAELRFKCQTCQRQLVTKASRAGQLHRCPGCQSFVQVPTPAPPPAKQPENHQSPSAPVSVESPAAERPPVSTPSPPPRLLTWPIVCTAASGLFFGGLGGASIAPLQSQKTFADHQLRKLLQDPRQYGLEPISNPALRHEALRQRYLLGVGHVRTMLAETADAIESHQPASPDELSEFCNFHNNRLSNALCELERPPDMDWVTEAEGLGAFRAAALAQGFLEVHRLHPVGSSTIPGGSYDRSVWHQKQQPIWAAAIRLAMTKSVYDEE